MILFSVLFLFVNICTWFVGIYPLLLPRTRNYKIVQEFYHTLEASLSKIFHFIREGRDVISITRHDLQVSLVGERNIKRANRR